MCRCKGMPECKATDCTRRADCDTGGFCYEHDPFDFSVPTSFPEVEMVSPPTPLPAPDYPSRYPMPWTDEERAYWSEVDDSELA